jgi:hypothetical protein
LSWRQFVAVAEDVDTLITKLGGRYLWHMNVSLVGQPCPSCGSEMMEISTENLQKCLVMKPVFKSIPQVLLKKKLAFTPICPKCDMYALGIEMLEGIPIRDKNGNSLTVHDLDEN